MKEFTKSNRFAYKICHREITNHEGVAFIFHPVFLQLNSGECVSTAKGTYAELEECNHHESDLRDRKHERLRLLITDDARLELNKQTSVRVNNESIQAILETLLKNSNLAYSVVERQVSLYRVVASETNTDKVDAGNEITQQKGV